jgi:hypothetical protein
MTAAPLSFYVGHTKNIQLAAVSLTCIYSALYILIPYTYLIEQHLLGKMDADYPRSSNFLARGTMIDIGVSPSDARQLAEAKHILQI